MPPRGRRTQAKESRPKIVIKPEELSRSNETENIMIHGHPGAGKTALCGGICGPKGISGQSRRKFVFLSTEKGSISAKRTGSLAKLIRAYDWDHIVAGVNWCDNNLGQDDWVIVDSTTKMQILLMRHILRTEGADLDVPERQHYLRLQNMLMRFTDHIIDSGYNSIFTANSMIREDSEGEDLILPYITGKDYDVSNYISAQMDAVYYLGITKNRDANDRPVRRILTETYPPFFARDRYGVFERWIDIPYGEYDTLAWMINTINNEG